MSELGITVYSVLLVWMRAVNDWFWSVLSGGGHGLYTQQYPLLQVRTQDRIIPFLTSMSDIRIW